MAKGKGGRNESFCKLYKQENRREKSKARKMFGHLQRHPMDAIGRKVFTDRYESYLPKDLRT